jgi:hypothetical protein
MMHVWCMIKNLIKIFLFFFSKSRLYLPLNHILLNANYDFSQKACDVISNYHLKTKNILDK